MISIGTPIAQDFPPDNAGAGVGGPCVLPVDKPNVLFDLGDTKTTSHIITVGPDEVVVVSAQGITDSDVLVFETVTGCKLGDLFECFRASCGCPVQIDCTKNRVILRYTGRYRVRVVEGTPGAYRVTAYPMSGAAFTENEMSCGCSSGKSGAAAVDSIIASPSAMAGLCQALRPCMEAAVQTVVETTVIEAMDEAPQAVAQAAPPTGADVGDRWYNTDVVAHAGVPPLTWATWNGNSWLIDTNIALRIATEPTDPRTGDRWFNDSAAELAGVPSQAWATWDGLQWLVDTNQPFDLSDIPPGSIPGSAIAPNSITSAHIVDGSITGADIALNSITSAHIVDGSITGADIAPNSITSAHIVDGSITGADIAPGTIGPVQLDPGQVMTQANVIAAIGCVPQCIAEKGAADGYAPLNANSRVPALNRGVWFSLADPTAADGVDDDIWFKYV